MTPLNTAPAVEIDDGLLIPYVEQGHPDGVPLDPAPRPHRLPPLLRARARGAAATRSARSRSPPAATATPASRLSGYDAARMAADVIEVMDALGIERAIVAGHSMGSWTARRVAADLPGSRARRRARRRVRDLPRQPRNRRAGARSSAPWTIRSTRPTPASGRTARWPARCPRRSWRWSSRRPASPRRASGGGAPGPDRRPPRAARDDPRAGAALLRRARRVRPAHRPGRPARSDPGAELRVYEGGGHALHWERPDRFAADLVEFAAMRAGRIGSAACSSSARRASAATATCRPTPRTRGSAPTSARSAPTAWSNDSGACARTAAEGSSGGR